MTEPGTLPHGLAGLLAGYLSRQRWYAGPADLRADGVTVVVARELGPAGDRGRHLHQVIVDAGGARYLLLVGQRPAGERAEFLNGHEASVLGADDHSYFYDATLDAELALQLLPIVTAGAEHASWMRPISAEQSNTSLVFDDRIILKIYRRLQDGPNPDVAVTTALADGGFAHVAAPVASWREDGVDLAFAQQYLSGGTDGWALAQTSLRDFYDAVPIEPSGAGGDFGMEAGRLGRVTAELHLAMAGAFGIDRDRLRDEWSALVDDIEDRLVRVGGDVDPSVPARAGRVARQLRTVRDPGAAVRVHGDYHLGQVMRTDGGWFVLDFEGEPARPLAERLAPSSPFKDLSGMLRSFDYAARYALVERGEAAAELATSAEAWQAHNGRAFLAGYLDHREVEGLLAPLADRDTVLATYELDKALYELAYERAYRPEWVPIPAGAVERIVDRLDG